MSVKGYKVFNPDWTCRGFQYAVGQTYKMEGPVILCESGFHFCKNAVDCFNHYSFNSDNKVAEVIAHGTVKEKDDKCCTDKIEIVREISWQEVLTLVNTGKDCTGRYNSGSCNSGNRNSGDCNSGNYNTGDCNTGNRNSGNYNSGRYNSGRYNTGDWNTGDWNTGSCNSGSCNSGDWNSTSFSNGCFNTTEPKIYMFNRPSNWTYRDWMNSRACELMRNIDNCPLEYIQYDDMTDEEKATHPEAKTVGGYLKKRTTADNARKWWAGLPKEDKTVIKSLPNFNAAIFKEITGVDVLIKEQKE